MSTSPRIKLRARLSAALTAFALVAISTVMLTPTAAQATPVPTAVSRTFDIPEDMLLSGFLTTTSTDTSSKITFTVDEIPSVGLFGYYEATGLFTYQPPTNFIGEVSLKFRAYIDGYWTQTATITIVVTPMNDSPDAQSLYVSGTADTEITGVVTAVDVDDDVLTFAAITNPAHGTVIMNPITGEFTYTPDPDFTGQDSFDYIAYDGLGASSVDTVFITVNSAPQVNTPPTADSVVVSGTADTVITGTLLGTDVDPDTLSYSIASTPASGSTSIHTTTGEFTYTPTPGFEGTDSFTYTVNDGSVSSAPATVTITVIPAPTATPGAASGTAGTVITGAVTGTDPEGHALTYDLGKNPASGSVTLDKSTGVFNYTPNAGFVGTDVFTFTVYDGTVRSAEANVTITVSAAPAPIVPAPVDPAPARPADPVEPVVPVAPAASQAPVRVDPVELVSIQPATVMPAVVQQAPAVPAPVELAPAQPAPVEVTLAPIEASPEPDFDPRAAVIIGAAVIVVGAGGFAAQRVLRRR